MKKTILFVALFFTAFAIAQDHFIGVNTSSRTGILNASINPAELYNLSRKFEINMYGMSFNVSNNIISLDDLSSDTDIENLIFRGDKAISAAVDFEFAGPGFAMKWQKWAFGVNTKGNIKFDLVDIDPKLSNALFNSEDITANGTTTIVNDYNQRMNGVSWGEIALSAARNIYENEKHSINGGLSLKLLFPGSYTNFGMDKFTGNVTTVYNQANPSNSSAFLTTNGPVLVNFSYSGNLADRYTETNDYSSSIFGNFGGVALDFGFNYRLKDENNKYKVNAGMSFRNIGTMTYRDSNNTSNTYNLNIPAINPLNLNEFDGTESLSEVENILKSKGYLSNEVSNKDFKTKLPGLFSMYGDFKVYHKFFITGYMQRKLGDDNQNRQITAQNSFSIIPRISFNYFEAYLPITNSEIAGTNTGLGFRVGGFYLGSGSAISALFKNAKGVDFNMGFRWAFL